MPVPVSADGAGDVAPAAHVQHLMEPSEYPARTAISRFPPKIGTYRSHVSGVPRVPDLGRERPPGTKSGPCECYRR
jgi:hypothetical protein